MLTFLTIVTLLIISGELKKLCKKISESEEK